ncbi:pyridoxamine 5'-phosphate oxidase [Microbulbifer sp. TYP-18]|uniref:pyridoxamine 5'-phosphate oxidase n=1 Tax=Microbulbifer sp. TYP-18 TaxID=3230024 RepID=UPI0034C5B897
MDIEHWRREYLLGGLSREDLKDNPVQQFEQWLGEVAATNLSDPSCMSLGTVGADGRPSQRIVLLKGYDADGFAFYTNLDSHKARDIAANPQVCLLFPWQAVERQVIVYGRAEPLTRTESATYFAKRPRDSQLAAWASHQSAAVESRQRLEEKFDQAKQRYAGGEVPLPDHWGGYRVVHEAVEFWQGRANRLHDRFVYRRQTGDDWAIERLAP